MKAIKIELTGVVFFLLLLSAVACKKDKDPKPSAAELTTQQLISSAWTLANLTVDGVDQTNMFADITLSFTTSNFITTNGNPVWPSSGTWAFTDNTATEILRSDGVTLTIEGISETKLELSFMWNDTSFAEGREGSIEGQHIFTFTR